jgi:hypothetical protein
MAPLPVLEKSRPVANPSAGRDTYDMPTEANLQLKMRPRAGTDQLLMTRQNPVRVAGFRFRRSGL